jgi:hypothetical protein
MFPALTLTSNSSATQYLSLFIDSLSILGGIVGSTRVSSFVSSTGLG